MLWTPDATANPPERRARDSIGSTIGRSVWRRPRIVSVREAPVWSSPSFAGSGIVYHLLRHWSGGTRVPAVMPPFRRQTNPRKRVRKNILHINLSIFSEQTVDRRPSKDARGPMTFCELVTLGS